jgi:all-trans-retinol dehydrogenase (NAD+)
MKSAINEPLLTGALLYLLTRGPSRIRDRLLQPFQNNVLARNGSARLASFITMLKILVGMGVVRRTNRTLNNLAWNNWRLFGRHGKPFRFGPGKEELVIITGGSSGFGYEMVKGFSNVARIVVLDITAFPQELAKRTYSMRKQQSWQNI